MTLRRVFLAIAIVPALAWGQPRPGDRVRLVGPATENARIKGDVLYADSGRVMVRLSGGVPPKTYRLTELHRMEMSKHSHTNGLKGAVIGTLVGAIVGLVGANSAENSLNKKNCVNCARTLAPIRSVLTVIGAGTGLAAGGVIGLGIRTEEWEPVELPLGPGIPRRIGLSVRY